MDPDQDSVPPDYYCQKAAKRILVAAMAAAAGLASVVVVSLCCWIQGAGPAWASALAGASGVLFLCFLSAFGQKGK